MNKKIKIFVSRIIFFVFMATSLSSFAETSLDQDMNRQIKELMKAREEMIKSLFNNSGFQNFDQKFDDLIKRFDHNNFGAGPDMGMDTGEVIGEYDWRETPTHEVFVLKVKQIKNKPLDIKIEKGQIKLKGDVESVELNNQKSRRITKVHFERIFSIPAGVDQNNPEFDNKAGELLIKFKKLKMTKTAPEIKKIEPIDQHRPIDKDSDDLTI